MKIHNPATGEVISAEDLGGGDMHARKSGVVDHLAQDDAHALHLVRRIVANLNTVKNVGLDLREPIPPAFDAESIYGVIPDEIIPDLGEEIAEEVPVPTQAPLPR